jgi:toxin ParE1/3/4
MLAESPIYGRPAPQLAPDLRRSEYQSHVIFYQPADAGVLIVRVLHAHMDPSQHI